MWKLLVILVVIKIIKLFGLAEVRSQRMTTKIPVNFRRRSNL